MELLANFFGYPLFSIYGGILAVIGALAVLIKALALILDITPVILKFGTALQSRKIGVFGSPEAHLVLKEILIDSKLFKDKNITLVNTYELSKGKKCSIYLVDWSSCSDNIDEIFLQRASEQTAVIIFAEPGSIDQTIMTDIANRANTVVVNFKGRLLNDVLTSLVTTSYG